ncbi:hypothetical protein DXT77_14660 [Pseudomonas sp. 91RF]|nr:hypothetical protein DXT77_14660 [Pseudomonas sp. 91RF]
MPSIHRCSIPLLLLTVSLGGCQINESPPAIPPTPLSSEQSSERYIPVQRFGRYTLVELKPEPAKQDLLLQIIDINLPAAWAITVGDALRYVLMRSGFRLCERTSENAALFALPLPAAHLKLGPIVLREALQLLAGQAWLLQTDAQLRQVCFIPATRTNIPTHNTIPLEAIK